MILTEDKANQVWAILVDVCGADDDDMRQQFVHHSGETDRLEFRFQGDLGFGGKVCVEAPPRVSTYPDENTARRSLMIEDANSQLNLLWNDWK